MISVFILSSQLSSQEVSDKIQIQYTLDNWHRAAGAADYNTYFDLMTNDAVFIGTDASENWQIAEFKAYAKPHFDKGRAWDFTPLDRKVYINEKADIAWFDELLSTQMKLCRGSGVLMKVSGKWKIAHYVLSIVIPNENVYEVIQLKQEKDDMIIENLSKH